MTTKTSPPATRTSASSSTTTSPPSRRCLSTRWRSTTSAPPALDLDSLYGRGPSDQPFLYQLAPNDALFVIGKTSPTPGGGDPTVKPSLDFDLPRGPQGLAVIGDPRNDENLIVAHWIIDWRRFFQFPNDGVTAGLSRKLDPFLAPRLSEIPNGGGKPGINLPIANLRRGSSLGLPSGPSWSRDGWWAWKPPRDSSMAGSWSMPTDVGAGSPGSTGSPGAWTRRCCSPGTAMCGAASLSWTSIRPRAGSRTGGSGSPGSVRGSMRGHGCHSMANSGRDRTCHRPSARAEPPALHAGRMSRGAVSRLRRVRATSSPETRRRWWTPPPPRASCAR